MQIMAKEKYKPNKNGWKPDLNDYVLVFMPDSDGLWVEVGHDIPQFRNMLLSDYLLQINLYIPDYTQFLRLVSDDVLIEYRAYDAMRVTIHFQVKK